METHPDPKGFPTNRTHLHSFVVIALLVVGVLGVYVPRWATPRLDQGSGSDDKPSYVSDLDFWQRTERETILRATARFDLDHDLNEIPLTVGQWKGEEVPDTNREVQILLEPEQYVRRLYHNENGQHVWLSLIGGRSSQPFHPPDICYDADGWQYNLGSTAFSLDQGGEVYALWLEADKQVEGESSPRQHIVSYFYLFPNEQRELSDGIVLFKLTSGRYNSAEETLALHEDFLRNFFSHAH